MNLRKIRPWAFYFLAWTLVGLIYFAQNVTRRFYWEDPNPWQDLRYWSANIYISALLTPLIVWAGRRWPLERQRLGRLLALHFLLSIAWALSRLSLEATFHLTWNEFWPIQPPITFKSEITLLFIFGFHTGRRGLLGGAHHPDRDSQLRALPGARAGGAALRPARLTTRDPGGAGAARARSRPSCSRISCSTR